MMKINISRTSCVRIACFLLLSSLSRLSAAESGQPAGGTSKGRFKHATATVDLPDEWDKVNNGNDGDKDLRIKSKDGQEVIVSVDIPEKDIPEGDLERVSGFVLQARLRALQLLADNSAQLAPEETFSLRGAVTRKVNLHSAQKKTRTALRVEATAKRIRTTIVMDNDSSPRRNSQRGPTLSSTASSKGTSQLWKLTIAARRR